MEMSYCRFKGFICEDADNTGSCESSDYKTGICPRFDDTIDDFVYPEGDYITEKIPPLVNNMDNTFTDTETLLTWFVSPYRLKCKTWQEAVVFVDFLSSGRFGLSDGSEPRDWRIPTIKELLSLTKHFDGKSEEDCSLLDYNGDDEIDTEFWTSESDTEMDYYAFSVDVVAGHTHDHGKDTPLYILPVRDFKPRITTNQMTYLAYSLN